MSEASGFDIIFHGCREVELDYTVNSCRMYDCCGECGMTFEDAKADVIDYYIEKAERLRKASKEDFLAEMGLGLWAEDEG